MIVLKSLPLEVLFVSTLLIVSLSLSQASATEIRRGSRTAISVGTVSTTQIQPQRSQIQNPEFQETEPTQILGQRIESGELPDGLSSGDWASILHSR